ncbi:MAG: heavy metal translocating P-type ATPase [Propionibacteriaceae bacterium]|nr:heavy metal translocating P-type ATPase [Propionibacteriaceae bacterium]
MNTHTFELDITGMTCASCAARIEKKLNRVESVHASVNYATERASIVAPEQVSAQELIQVVEAAGYGASLPSEEPQADANLGSARLRLIVAIVLSVPIVAMAMVPSWQFPGWQWASLAGASVVVWWCDWGFHRAAALNLRHGTATMDTLVSMGTSAAYLWSLYALLFGHAGTIGMRHEFEFVLRRSDGLGNVYFEAACGIITFLLIGRYIEARSKHEAGSALRALLELGAKDALVLVDGKEVRVPIGAVRIGDQFVVLPGEKVATDGVVVSGASALDASLITGESLPVEVGAGDSIIGGTINTTGRLLARATAVGADTQLAHVARLIEQAQTGKANVQRLADKVSGVFVPVVIGIAAITLVGWLLAGAGSGFAFTAAVAVLIIACPCALGLATPTALLVGTGRGAQLGILIRGPEALEAARDIDVILLDKTGTVTTGEMSVQNVAAVGGRDELLALTACVEANSEHPIAKAIVRAAEGLPSPGEVEGFESLPGRGARAMLAGDEILVGNARLMSGVEGFAEEPVDLTVVHVARAGRYLGQIQVADAVKPTSQAAIAELKRLGLTPVLLTGDRREVADRVAAAVGIDRIVADALPADKVTEVESWQRTHRVSMVGDGVNDAAALAQADLGVAMGSGTDVAMAASDITLMRPDLVLAADAIRLSRRTLATIKSNLFWAFAYNTAAIPIAALGLLNPMLAGAAMSFSSVFVVLNSLRLRRFQPTVLPDNAQGN